MPPWPRSIAGRSRTSTACWSWMAWCSSARPALARWRGPCWSCSACARTARRRSSTFIWRPPRAPRNVSSSLAILVRRALTGERLEMLCVDGGSGLLAALPTAFPDVPVQRCWAHKIRNVLSKVRTPDQAAIKAGLHRIMNATILPAAWSAARRFADRWESIYPKAVACLRADLDDLLTCFRYATSAERKAVRTTNAIERRFREVRRRTRPMGTFQDRTSMDRILFAVFMHENRNQGLATPFALTHNS